MTTTTPVPTLEFDHHSSFSSNHRDEVLAQVAPYPVFWTHAHGGYWVVTGYEVTRRVLRDWETFSSLKTEEMTGGDTIPTVIGPRLIPAELDPPDHRALRKIITPHFLNKEVERLTPYIDSFITEVIDGVVAKGSFDVTHDIADKIPAGLMVAQLGFPDEERIPFIKSVQAALNVMPYAADEEFAKTQEMADGMVALGHAVGVIQSLIEARRAEPTEDLVSHICKPEFGLDDETLLWLTFTLLVGGAENPAATIGNSLLYLSQDTELRARIAADHSLIPAATEELLRQTSSAVSLARTVTRDVVFEGAQMKEGDRVLLWLPGANRDESVFERPSEVDIDRPVCPHVAFGDGPHVCIGAALFRRWFHILLREVLTKMPNYSIDLVRSKRFDDSATMWGWRTMPASTNL